MTDLWTYLSNAKKKIVLYGMGNGADKILAVCEKRGIAVTDVFATDEFVRGQSFHGFTVKKYADVKKLYGKENLIVLLAFGSSLPDVTAHILEIAAETELYIPDVPAFGDTLFDEAFAESHAPELEDAKSLLSDGLSRDLFDSVVQYRLSGKTEYLLQNTSTQAEIRSLLDLPERAVICDCGAYTGDTVRELLSSRSLRKVYAFEPDGRTFKKLTQYAGTETRCEVIPLNYALWEEDTDAEFSAEGNRNAGLASARSAVLGQAKTKTVVCRRLDSVVREPVDYVKYDVEGSEKEALSGSAGVIAKHAPTLLVSLYHRSEDLFALPLLIREKYPQYRRFHLRRLPGFPCWDLCLIAKP